MIVVGVAAAVCMAVDSVVPERRDLLGVERARAERAPEQVEQALPRRRVVEGRAEAARLRRPVEEVPQPHAGRRGRGAEEREHGHVARRELRRVQVPALVDAVGEGGGDVACMEPPGLLDHRPVLAPLRVGERVAGRGPVRVKSLKTMLEILEAAL